MRTLKTLLTNVRTRGAGRRAGILTTLLITGVLFGTLQARAACSAEEVFLATNSGYVNVTSYLQTDQYGNVWVVGYNNDPSFEIVVDFSDGHVYDPYGNVIGYCASQI